MNRRASTGTGIQRFRQRAAGYPPREFRGHKQATARPVPAGLSRRQMTSPRGSRRSAPAALARGLRVMAGLARPAPSCPRPRTASGRPDAAPHGRPRSPAPRAPGPGRRRTAGAAPGRRPGPGASADRSLGVLRSAAARSSSRFTSAALRTPAGRCTGGFMGNGGSTKQNPPRLSRAGCRDTLFELAEDYMLWWTLSSITRSEICFGLAGDGQKASRPSSSPDKRGCRRSPGARG